MANAYNFCNFKLSFKMIYYLAPFVNRNIYQIP